MIAYVKLVLGRTGLICAGLFLVSWLLWAFIIWGIQ